MNQAEAIHVLETMKEVYPRYEISKKKARMLIKELVKMDYPQVMKKLAHHVAIHPYPPTVMEISAYLKTENKQLEKLKQWRKQARDVPPELKRTFHQQMLKLIKDKSL